MSVYDEPRRAVAAASRSLAEAGLLIGTAGNVSLRVDDAGAGGGDRPGHLAVTATGAVLAEADVDAVSVVDRSGRVVAGDLAPTSEVDLHLRVHDRHRPGAVVHTHAPVATALACVLDELPCIHYQQMVFGGAVRVAPYATFGTPELAAGVTAALDGRSAALMANHGSVTLGDTLDQAVDNALLLEWLCTVYRDAAAVGDPRVLDAEQQDAVVAAAGERRYGSTQPATTRKGR
ncbi:MAG: class II aldolase/adducin family protein [Actinomycetota bacterium]|nr:class II aldolase/adducin family protein [Actinomycetota bacterium]